MICYNCKKAKPIFLPNISIVPYEKNIERLKSIFVFYQYKAPTIQSSKSIQKPKVSCVKVFNEFLKRENIEFKIVGQSSKISKHLEPMNLTGYHVCLKCSRFVTKRKNAKDGIIEEDYETFLRHIRNSIAHGNVYGFFQKNHTYLVFDDYSTDNKQALTARIVISKAQLERFQREIINIT